jgi:hypothetical protein
MQILLRSKAGADQLMIPGTGLRTATDDLFYGGRYIRRYGQMGGANEIDRLQAVLCESVAPARLCWRLGTTRPSVWRICNPTETFFRLRVRGNRRSGVSDLAFSLSRSVVS